MDVNSIADKIVSLVTQGNLLTPKKEVQFERQCPKCDEAITIKIAGTDVQLGLPTSSEHDSIDEDQEEPEEGEIVLSQGEVEEDYYHDDNREDDDDHEQQDDDVNENDGLIDDEYYEDDPLVTQDDPNSVSSESPEHPLRRGVHSTLTQYHELERMDLSSPELNIVTTQATQGPIQDEESDRKGPSRSKCRFIDSPNYS